MTNDMTAIMAATLGVQLVNCTPHPIAIRTPNGDLTIAPSGQCPR